MLNGALVSSFRIRLLRSRDARNCSDESPKDRTSFPSISLLVVFFQNNSGGLFVQNCLLFLLKVLLGRGVFCSAG